MQAGRRGALGLPARRGRRPARHAHTLRGQQSEAVRERDAACGLRYRDGIECVWVYGCVGVYVGIRSLFVGISKSECVCLCV